jgi:hypothetical protein
LRQPVIGRLRCGVEELFDFRAFDRPVGELPNGSAGAYDLMQVHRVWLKEG